MLYGAHCVGDYTVKAVVHVGVPYGHAMRDSVGETIVRLMA